MSTLSTSSRRLHIFSHSPSYVTTPINVHIMTMRQLRRRKEAPVSHVPTILDEIDVYWEVNGSTVWWPATVLEVFEHDKPTREDYFGKGKLLYKQFDKYPTEEADVEFFFTKRKGHLVYQNYNGKMLQMSWKPSETQDVNIGQATHVTARLAGSPSVPSKRRAESVTRKSKRGSLSKKKDEPLLQPTGVDSSIGQNGHVSTVNFPSTAGELIDGRNSQANASAAHTGSSSIDRGKGTGHNGGSQGFVGRDSAVQYRGPTDDGVAQVAALQQTTTQIFQTILSTSQQVMNNFASTTFHDQMAQLVMHELRIDFVNELHRHFRTPHTIQMVSSGMEQRLLQTSVSCPLHTFSTLAKKIQHGSSEGTVNFFPGFADTQNPSISSERFTIYFKSIHSLSSAMGFNDNRDFETMFFREKCRDGTYYSRIIGSLSKSTAVTLTNPHARPKTMTDPTTLFEKGTCTSSTTNIQTSASDKSKSEPGTAVQSMHSENVDIIFVGLSRNASLASTAKPENNDNPRSMGSSTGLNDIQSTDTKGTPSDFEQAGQNNFGVMRETSPSSPGSPVCARNSINGVALVRRRTLWDDETQDFLSQWECSGCPITTTPPEPSFFQTSARTLNGVFALRWERKTIPRSTAWTSDALRSDNHVLGKLEVMVPWVLLTGDQCVEVGDILAQQTFKIRT